MASPQDPVLSRPGGSGQEHRGPAHTASAPGSCGLNTSSADPRVREARATHRLRGPHHQRTLQAESPSRGPRRLRAALLAEPAPPPRPRPRGPRPSQAGARPRSEARPMGARRAPRHVRPAQPRRVRAGRPPGLGARRAGARGRGGARGGMRVGRGRRGELIGQRRVPRPLTAARRGRGSKTKGRRPAGRRREDASHPAVAPTAAARPGPSLGRLRAEPALTETRAGWALRAGARTAERP